jgi:hypothetical protein
MLVPRDTLEDLLMSDERLYIWVIVILFAVAPLMLFASLLWLSLKRPRATRAMGMALAFAVAIWASACWLLGGYFGVYPNLLPALLLVIPFGGSMEPWLKDSSVVALNFLIWPAAGWLFCHIASTGRNLASGGTDGL